jgi:hypothetical protein
MAIGKKVLMGAGLASVFGAGMFNSVAKGTIDNAMDIAFDNPEADQAVLGTDLTPSMIIAKGVGGTKSLPARFANAGAFNTYGANSPQVMAGFGVAGGTLGTLAGGALAGIGGRI